MKSITQFQRTATNNKKNNCGSLLYSSDERHPNAHTAPPVNRASMTATPWVNFWVGLLLGIKNLLLTEVFSSQKKQDLEPWQRAVKTRRTLFALLTITVTTVAVYLFLKIQPSYDNIWLQYGQTILFIALSTWIVVGFTTAITGFMVSLRGDPYAMKASSVTENNLSENVRTAIIMPICNEETMTVFAGLRAIAESVTATGHAQAFDIYILSDSSDPNVIDAERKAWEELRCQLAEQNRDAYPIEVYYRLRTRRVQRKSGNVADFCRRWGKNYRYMVVLDADSVMSGHSLVTLAKLMEANPTAGIIQTATQAVGQVTLHARVQQFAARVVGQIFTLGTQYWQLGEAHYFGHNAIIRIQPFMEHCALAPIKGQGGLAGHIMSHDFVEAALMRRAGYHVWMVCDLGESYEQQPSDLISELQRDRRWCQGNMQNSRLITQPGLHSVHRAMLATGFMSYFSAPLWMLYLALGTFLWFTLPEAQHAQVFNQDLFYLWTGTLCILFMPRVLGVTAVIIKKEQHLYGGTLRLIGSSLLEAVIALLQAPIRMVAHTIFVVTSLTGIKLEWKSPPREAIAVSWNIAVNHFKSVLILVAAAVLYIYYRDPAAIFWLLPVVAPLLLAVPITVLSSQNKLGASIRKHRLLLIPEEAFSPAVLRTTWRHIRQALQTSHLSSPVMA